MTIYSQRDPRWANLLMGNSGLTVGRAGCVITDIAMLTTYFLPAKTPMKLLHQLKFTNEGKIIWASASFENFAWYKRVYNRDEREIEVHIKNPRLAVILEVANRSHWVVATGYELLSKKIRIADPWTGDRASMDRYRNNITGASYFMKK